MAPELLLLLPFLFVAATAQTPHANISLGSSLVAGDAKSPASWLSPSGDFAFGFYPVAAEDNSSSNDGGRQDFLLAIWFNKVSDKAVVWSVPNKYSTLPQPGWKVELTTDGTLKLTDDRGDLQWLANATDAAYAALLDTGNLVLASRGFRSTAYIWQSFEHPTDTLLPAQVLWTKLDARLTARLSETSYASGRFTFRVQYDANVVFYNVYPPTGKQFDFYWTSDTYMNGSRLVYNESGAIYFVRADESLMWFTPARGISIPRDYYHRAVLEYDGVLRQYIHPRNQSNGSWQMTWHLPENICLSIPGKLAGSGACGFNSICRIKDSRPVCHCAPGHSYIDPNNTRVGCKRDVIRSCDSGAGGGTSPFYIQEMPNVDWPQTDYEELVPMLELDCRRSCADDCLCDVAVFGAGGCWKKKRPLANGREDPGYTMKAFIKIWNESDVVQSSSTAPAVQKSKHAYKELFIASSVVLGSSLLFNLFLFRRGRSPIGKLGRGRRAPRLKQRTPSKMATNLLHLFTYQDLEESTRGFEEELGHGSFGTVYKGVLLSPSGSETLVAVKKLDRVVTEGEKEFMAEVSIIGQTCHKNLVRLLGYCEEGAHRLLVYEYMSNGSLASFLFQPEKPAWRKRVDIAASVARGLAYLHEECSSPIIHCDIKPQNVLLDARISDFGLAKLLKTNQSRTLTSIRGTRGYVAPEWFRNAAITTKVDVYSFGVMLLEIVSCRRSFEAVEGKDEVMVLVDWAYDCYTDGSLGSLVGDDGEAMEDESTLEKLVMVAIWCVQEEPSMRPSMRKVSLMVEGLLDVPIPPNPSVHTIVFPL